MIQKPCFCADLNLFIFSMLLLVLGDNYVVMFMGWEGVGLCSYLLIGYWFTNNNYNYAAKKAFIMNRIGDLGFLLAIFWLIFKLGTVGYNEVLTATSLAKLSSTDITGITLLLLVGAMGKSAQIPLFTWLPDAMAGPTPPAGAGPVSRVHEQRRLHRPGRPPRVHESHSARPDLEAQAKK